MGPMSVYRIFGVDRQGKPERLERGRRRQAVPVREAGR
jgi:hypothetical protein